MNKYYNILWRVRLQRFSQGDECRTQLQRCFFFPKNVVTAIRRFQANRIMIYKYYAHSSMGTARWSCNSLLLYYHITNTTSTVITIISCFSTLRLDFFVCENRMISAHKNTSKRVFEKSLKTNRCSFLQAYTRIS